MFKINKKDKGISAVSVCCIFMLIAMIVPYITYKVSLNVSGYAVNGTYDAYETLTGHRIPHNNPEDIAGGIGNVTVNSGSSSDDYEEEMPEVGSYAVSIEFYDPELGWYYEFDGNSRASFIYKEDCSTMTYRDFLKDDKKHPKFDYVDGTLNPNGTLYIENRGPSDIQYISASDGHNGWNDDIDVSDTIKWTYDSEHDIYWAEIYIETSFNLKEGERIYSFSSEIYNVIKDEYEWQYCSFFSTEELSTLDDFKKYIYVGLSEDYSTYTFKDDAVFNVTYLDFYTNETKNWEAGTPEEMREYTFSMIEEEHVTYGEIYVEIENMPYVVDIIWQKEGYNKTFTDQIIIEKDLSNYKYGDIFNDSSILNSGYLWLNNEIDKVYSHIANKTIDIINNDERISWMKKDGYLYTQIEILNPVPSNRGMSYAIVTQESSTMYFIRSEVAPVVGGKYRGETIKKVFEDPEHAVAEDDSDSDYNYNPWTRSFSDGVNEYSPSHIRRVVIVDEMRPESIDSWFAGFIKCNYLDLRLLNTASTINMDSAFYETGARVDSGAYIEGLGQLSTSKVQNMAGAFKYAHINNIEDINNWNYSAVQTTHSMFQYFNCNKSVKFTFLKDANLSYLTDAGAMFTTFNTGENPFCVDMSNLYTPELIDASSMFSSSGSDAKTWKVIATNWQMPKLKYMGYFCDAAGRSSYEWDIEGIETWDMSGVADLRWAFRATGRNAPIDMDLSTWDVSKCENFYGMFDGAASQNSNKFYIGNISQWNFSAAYGNRSAFGSMFNGAGKNATYTLDISSWDTGVTRIPDNFKAGVETKIITPWG